MRTFVLVTASIVIFGMAPAVAQDCAAIQTACIDQCFGITGQLPPSGVAQQNLAVNNVPGRAKACINRCRIAPCGQTPLTARLCNNGFRACNDACVPSTATTAAGIQSQASCGTTCCTQFKNCLFVRQCDISTITVINCSENPGAPPTTTP